MVRSSRHDTRHCTSLWLALTLTSACAPVEKVPDTGEPVAEELPEVEGEVEEEDPVEPAPSRHEDHVPEWERTPTPSAWLEALAAEEALVVAARGAPTIHYALQRWDGAGWLEIGRLSGDELWIGDPVPEDTLLRAEKVLRGETTPPFEPIAVSLSWEEEEEGDLPLLLEGDDLELELALTELPEPGLGRAALHVWLEIEGDPLYLPEGCLDEDCWSEEHQPWLQSDDLALMDRRQLVSFEVPARGPVAATLHAELSLEREGEQIAVASDERSFVLLGGRWRWGDLHAHSRWSNDGCEDPDTLCGPRGAEPAEDFFSNAVDVGLDFAAITDHAEWDWYWPDGAEGDPISVWDGQAGTAAAAVDTLVLPILGYEWSHGSELMEGAHRRGSHRTVLLSDASACESYRIGGLYSEDAWTPEKGDWYFTSDNAYRADSVADLWTALDDADTICGTELRWVTFAHHSAYEIPQATDWALSENQPDRETLIEIFSEHGLSECLDTSEDGCDFGLNERQTYYPDGSAQAALDAGFQLGFVAGTDSHDARPGSLDDGPGEVAWWRDSDGDGIDDTPTVQFSDGGLTGALISGELDVDRLFDALEARMTVATSGPRPELRLALVGLSGQVYPPGATVSVSDSPFSILFELEDAVDATTGATLDRVDQIGPGGEVVRSGSDRVLELGWAPESGDWTYLRLRYLYEDGTEARVWVSPFFAE